MATLLFVHGTGVREESYNATLGMIESQVSGWSGLQVKGCFWGEVFGTWLHAGGASVPTLDATRAGIPEEAASPDDLVLLLRADPLAELRLLAISSTAAGGLPLSATAGMDLQDHLRALA